jgi:hypothetical protein
MRSHEADGRYRIGTGRELQSKKPRRHLGIAKASQNNNGRSQRIAKQGQIPRLARNKQYAAEFQRRCQNYETVC